MKLAISIDDLLKKNIVENERIEFKENFNPEVILHTMCAFANDFNNWGGGYIILGVNDKKEIIGIDQSEIDKILKKLVELSNKIHYPYFPIVDTITYHSKSIILIYCPGGPARPYRAPKYLLKGSEYKYYIRHFASTVIANSEEERELIGMSNQIPFDDQINFKASLENLNIQLIKNYLKEIGSLLDINHMIFEDICQSLNLGDGSKECLKPKNIALLLFSNNPEKYIKTPWIEITMFYDKNGDKFEEEKFSGDIISQIKLSLHYIKNLVIKEKVVKISGQAESKRYYSYPYDAIEEALVNAVFHKSYEIDAPIEIRIEFDRIDIISYPGPLPPLNKDNLNERRVISKRYRNRRLGDFLKELHLTEGKNTGFRKIRSSLAFNGSKEPEFITDSERTYFITRLWIHEEFKLKAWQATEQVTGQVTEQARIIKLLKYCTDEHTSLEIRNFLNLAHREHFRKEILTPLIKNGFLNLTIPDKPKSPNQKYITTKKGMEFIKK